MINPANEAEGVKGAGVMNERRRSVDRRQSLTIAEQKKVAALMAALEHFRILRPTMPAQYIYAFLMVCEDEGRGVTEYAQQAGVAQSVMSRHLLDLGDRDRSGQPGFGLVTLRQDPLNLRRHQAILTDKGRMLWHQVSRALDKA